MAADNSHVSQMGNHLPYHNRQKDLILCRWGFGADNNGAGAQWVARVTIQIRLFGVELNLVDGTRRQNAAIPRATIAAVVSKVHVDKGNDAARRHS